MALVTDKIDIKLDTTNDIALVGGDFVWTSGLEGVVQAIKIALQTIRGEWFLDLEQGVPYYAVTIDGEEVVSTSEALLGEVFDETKALTAFRTAILAVEHVSEILLLAVSFEGATRAMTVNFRVRTTFGDSDTERVAA